MISKNRITELVSEDWIERPFEYLRRKDGQSFDDTIVRNWYISRAFVLEKLKDIAFRPDENRYLHVIVLDDTPLMLSVIRQVALLAHYFNFDDKEGQLFRNSSVITIVSNNPGIRGELDKEEYLCNLPKYCKVVERDNNINADILNLDLEIHIVDDESNIDNESDSIRVVFSERDILDFCEYKKTKGEDILSIDTRKSFYTENVYNLGEEIDNIPAEDIHCAERYSLALNYFQNHIFKKPFKKLVDDDVWNKRNNQCVVKEKISNIFCSDCFKSRWLGIHNCCDGDSKQERWLWGKYIEALSMSEHARWVVEKLIMGYSPLNAKQRFLDESLAYDNDLRKAYRKQLKRNPVDPVHIDLCSYADVRRIDPDNLKYDSFLVLAIPKILEKVRIEDTGGLL